MSIYIRPTRLLKVGLLNAKYDLEGRLRKGYTGVNWSDDGEIETMITNDNEDDDEENP